MLSSRSAGKIIDTSLLMLPARGGMMPPGRKTRAGVRQSPYSVIHLHTNRHLKLRIIIHIWEEKVKGGFDGFSAENGEKGELGLQYRRFSEVDLAAFGRSAKLFGKNVKNLRKSPCNQPEKVVHSRGRIFFILPKNF